MKIYKIWASRTLNCIKSRAIFGGDVDVEEAQNALR